AEGFELSASEWNPWVEHFSQEGWQLDNIEFRHNRFDVDEHGQPSRSHFYFAARLTRSAGPVRAMLEGKLIVDWQATRSGEGPPSVKRIDATHLKLTSRSGEPPFQLILQETLKPEDRSGYIDPLILYDLDGDGLSEIILVGKNLVYR